MGFSIRDLLGGAASGFIGSGFNPIGALVGGIGGAVSGSSGGSRRPAQQQGSTFTPSYNDVLQQGAFMRAFMDAAGPPGAIAQGTGFATTGQQQQRTQQAPAAQLGGRAAKQAGGMTGASSPANMMRQRQAQEAGAGGMTMNKGMDPRRPQGQPQQAAVVPGAPTQPTTSDMYQQFLQRGIGGQNTLPTSAYQHAFSRGAEAINQQAQQSRRIVGETLGARGMLHSGLMASGVGEVERGRLGGISDLAYDLEAQELSARRRSQEVAAGFLASQQSATQAQAARRGEIRMQQPSTGDYLAQLLGAGAQYYIGQQMPRPDYASFLAQPQMAPAPALSSWPPPGRYRQTPPTNV